MHLELNSPNKFSRVIYAHGTLEIILLGMNSLPHELAGRECQSAIVQHHKVKLDSIGGKPTPLASLASGTN